MMSALALAFACILPCYALGQADQGPAAQENLRQVPGAAFHLAQANPTRSLDPFNATPAPSPEQSEAASSDSGSDPFGTGTRTAEETPSSEAGCGPDTSLARAELRKPDLAVALCEERFSELDKEWLFILYYISGFNEFLEERGAFMDPTGACSRAVEPRQSLSLIYETIDFIVGGGEDLDQNERFEKMLEPFYADWKRAPFVLMELRVWKREGRLDATSIASRGMCGDPKFKLFWSKAIEYAQRVPGTNQ